MEHNFHHNKRLLLHSYERDDEQQLATHSHTCIIFNWFMESQHVKLCMCVKKCFNIYAFYFLLRVQQHL